MADTRIHGTTKKQVRRVLEEVERRALQPLSAQPFPFYHEGKRNVHRDGHVEVAKGYYAVPPEYLGREVWVRWDSRLVRAFNSQFEQIAVHPRVARVSLIPVALIYLITLTLGLGATILLWSDITAALVVIVQAICILAIVTLLEQLGGK